MSNIIKKPLITEKLSMLSEKGIYAFLVDKKATKTDVRKSIEKNFDVKVDSVKTMICRGRSKRTVRGNTNVRYWKKALVKLKSGEKISLFEGA